LERRAHGHGKKAWGKLPPDGFKQRRGDEAGWITFYLGQARLSSVMKQLQQQAHAAQRNKSFGHTQVAYDLQVLIGAYRRVFQMQTLAPCCMGEGAGVFASSVAGILVGLNIGERYPPVLAGLVEGQLSSIQ
jgi:hypothetical protein